MIKLYMYSECFSTNNYLSKLLLIIDIQNNSYQKGYNPSIKL